MMTINIGVGAFAVILAMGSMGFARSAKTAMGEHQG
jgi:hypothetical protein